MSSQPEDRPKLRVIIGGAGQPPTEPIPSGDWRANYFATMKRSYAGGPYGPKPPGSGTYSRPLPPGARFTILAWIVAGVLVWPLFGKYTPIVPLCFDVFGTLFSILWINHYERLTDRDQAERDFKLLMAFQAAWGARNVVETHNYERERLIEQERAREAARDRNIQEMMRQGQEIIHRNDFRPPTNS